MRKIIFAALAALVLASCSKNNEDAAGGNTQKATLYIGVKAPEMSRAATTGNIPSDANIKDFKVFVVDGDNSLKSGYVISGETTGSAEIAVTNKAKRVYVIANAGNIAMENEAAILNYLADLNGTGSQTNYRWATGQANLVTNDFKDAGGGKLVASKNITLTFIAARITVKIEMASDMKNYYNGNASDGSLVLKKIAVLNARGESKLFGESLIPQNYTKGKKWYTGINNNNFKYFPENGQYTYTANLLSNNLFTNITNGNYYYYVFENDTQNIDKYPTIVTLLGTYAGQDIYFPVHLAPYESWGPSSESHPDFITRGYSYDITITLTGDPRFKEGGDYPGDTGGSKDPTDPHPNSSAKIKVNVSLNNWVPITLNKEF